MFALSRRGLRLVRRVMQYRAFHIMTECPRCQAGSLQVRRNHRDQSAFIGCSRFPRCKFTETYDDYIQELAEQLSLPTGELTELATVTDATCKKLLQIVHPDKLSKHAREAHEATTALLALRRLARKFLH